MTQEDLNLYYQQTDHISSYMNELYFTDTFVIKKKANFRERLSCGLISVDNVYKIFEWDENTVTKGKRLIRLE